MLSFCYTKSMEVLPLKEHRKRAYLTTRELADKADVAYATVWRIESGKAQGHSLKTMRKIAEALGVHPNQVAEFQTK